MVHGFSWLSAPYPRRKCSTASTLFAPSPSPLERAVAPYRHRDPMERLFPHSSPHLQEDPTLLGARAGTLPCVCTAYQCCYMCIYVYIYIYTCVCGARPSARAFVVGLLLLSIGEEIKKEIVSSRCFKLPFITTHKPETRAEKSYARSGHLVPPSSRGGGG